MTLSSWTVPHHDRTGTNRWTYNQFEHDSSVTSLAFGHFFFFDTYIYDQAKKPSGIPSGLSLQLETHIGERVSKSSSMCWIFEQFYCFVVSVFCLSYLRCELTTSTRFTEGYISLPGENPLVVAPVPVSVWYLEIREDVVPNLIWSSQLCAVLCWNDCIRE